MFTHMDTLDRCIRDLILAHPKRSGPSGRSVGAKVPGRPGVAAPLKRRRRTIPDAGDKPRGANDGRRPIHDLRDGLDARVAEDERIVVSSPRTIASVTAGKSAPAKINFAVLQSSRAYSGVLYGAYVMTTVCNH